jgi:hypothetical protein
MRGKGNNYSFQSSCIKRYTQLCIILFLIFAFQFQEITTYVESYTPHFNREDSSSKINWLEATVIHGDLPPSFSSRNVHLHPQITCDVKDNLHVVWTQRLYYYDQYDQPKSINQLCYRSFNARKESWSEIQLLVNDTYTPDRPKIFVDKEETIHFTWLNIRDIMYTSFNGTSWSDEIMAVEKRNDSSPLFDFVVSENGKAYFVWDEIWNTKNHELFIRYFDYMNNSSSSISQITNSNYWSRVDSLAINSKQELHLTWNDKDIPATKAEVFYQVLDENLNQIEPIEIISIVDEHRSEDSQLVIDSKDNVHVVWTDEDLFDFRNISYKSKINGNWQPIDLLTVKGIAFYPDIYCDKNDNKHIVWLEAGNDYRYFYYKSLTKDNRWLNTTELPYLDSQFWPIIAADGRGNVHVVFDNDFSYAFEKGLIHLFGKKAPILEIHGLTIISVIVPSSLLIIVIVNIILITRKRK